MSFSTHYGCYFWQPANRINHQPRYYLPQVRLEAHTQIQSTASRTKLTQTFVNDTSSTTPEIHYTFPLYDGVSVVSFQCTVGKKVIIGVVREKNQARDEYKQAVARGEAAGLLEQSYEASDVFSTKIGNIAAGEAAIVEIEYVGELRHDSQLDGVRFTIPTSIAPRYGTFNRIHSPAAIVTSGKIEIVVDIEVDDGSHIEGVSSPSHPIAMTLGKTSTQKEMFRINRASATLSLGTAELEKDFVVVINAQDQGVPKALLESHPDIPNHRALMATLVPKFNLPNIHPEVVFIVDRSGSMNGKIHLLVEALRVFLKSLPLSAKFNICSFGSQHSFMFPKSVPYDERSLETALTQLNSFDANYGGTEMLQPIRQTVKNRLSGIPLEIMVLTDGEIWNQQETFDFVNDAAKKDIRLFSLGIGAGASTSLVEGLARAGNGFAQFVQDNERMDKRVVRMLKAALSPHITDYHLQVIYDEAEGSDDDDFELIESATVKTSDIPSRSKKPAATPAAISLFDSNFQETAPNPPAGRYDHLPEINPPKVMRAPSKISGLLPFERTSAYLLLPDSSRGIKSVMLHGTYNRAPLQLEFPIQRVGTAKTIHQLAAKKAMLDTEEGRGWLSTVTATTTDKTLLKIKHSADWDRIVEREAVRLGVTFQVAGKFCSFVAVESNLEQERVLHVQEVRDAPTMVRGSLFGSATAAPMMAYQGTAPPLFGGVNPPSHNSGGYGVFGGAVRNSYQQQQQQRRRRPQQRQEMQMQMQQAQSFGYQYETQRPEIEQPTRRQSIINRDTKRSSAAFSFSSVPPSSGSIRKAYSPSMVHSYSAFHASPSASLMGAAALGQSSGFGSAPAVNNPFIPASKTHRLIGLQHFDGSWSATDNLFQLTGVWRAEFDDATFSLGDDDDTVKATLVAIAWFEKEASRDREVWDMVVDKAITWITGKCVISEEDVHAAVTRVVAVFFP